MALTAMLALEKAEYFSKKIFWLVVKIRLSWDILPFGILKKNLILQPSYTCTFSEYIANLVHNDACRSILHLKLYTMTLLIFQRYEAIS